MKYLYILPLLLVSYFAQSQKLLKGIVVEEETSKPISAASVFLNNTSVGTTTNSQGYFELSIASGKFDLIVSSIGFETYSQTITANEANLPITIKLKTKVKTLEAVVVEPFLKDGWEKWGRFFMENFIGTSAFAKDCRIKNIQAIKFRHSKEDDALTVIALEPLIIENKALGYTIRYQLENFTYHFRKRYVFYQGYPFFEPMAGNAAKQKRWTKNRIEAYEGSLMHFMRSLYRNTTMEEGFKMNRLKKIVNTEKQRVRELYKKATRTVQTGNASIRINDGQNLNPDSSAYYSTVMKQADEFDVMSKIELTGDSVAFAIDSTTAGLSFDNYLLVVYKNKVVPAEYEKYAPGAGKAILSQVTLLNEPLIAIQANGAYYHPTNLMTIGYWGWSEKIAYLLPYDYKKPADD